MAYLLIIDDDRNFAVALQPILTLDGHESSITPSNSAVIQKISERRPDLIILDVASPEAKAKSIDIAQTIQRRDALDGIPILMLTSLNDDYPFNFTVRDLGTDWFPVSDFLEKPVDFALLREKISSLLLKTGLKSKVSAQGHPLP